MRGGELRGRVAAAGWDWATREKMQDSNADTKWKDILRKRGILPSEGSLKDLEKEAEERVLQQSIVKMYEDMTLEEPEDNEEEFSEEDERAIEKYR